MKKKLDPFDTKLKQHCKETFNSFKSTKYQKMTKKFNDVLKKKNENCLVVCCVTTKLATQLNKRRNEGTNKQKDRLI